MEKANKSCLDSSKIEHLIRILNLTTSNYDGEALSAVRRANEFLKSHEMRWADILFNNSLNSKEKNIEIDELIAENKILKKEIISLKKDKQKLKVNYLQQNIKIAELISENKILKKEASPLKGWVFY